VHVVPPSDLVTVRHGARVMTIAVATQ